MADPTQEQQISEFAFELGADVKQLFTLLTGAANIVSLVNLKTNTKANLVAALNEVFELAEAAAGSGGGAVINDNAPSATTTYSGNKIEQVSTAKAAAIISDGTTGLGTTWSSTKINNAISNVAGQVQTILDSSPEAYNTFKEVSDYIASDKSGADAMLASIQNRLRVDADQTFTADQISFGLGNLVKLGVAKQSDLAALKTAIGSTTTSYKAIYLAAKNS